MQQVRRYPLALFGLIAVATVGFAAVHGGPGAARAATPTSLSVAVAAPGVAAPGVVVTRPVTPRPAATAAPKDLRRPVAVPHVTVVRQRVAVTRHVVVPQAPAPAVAAPATAGGDAYPYRDATTNDPDAWGFTQRQCVSYVAWRLSGAGHAVSNRTDGWGSASNWDDTARRVGVTVTSTPRVGSVAQWDPSEASDAYAPGSTHANGRFTAGEYGHVAYVTAVYADGSVQVDQYNAQGDRVFSSLRMRAPRFLVFS